MEFINDLIVIHEKDPVAVAARPLAKGETIHIKGKSIVVKEDIPVPHKMALREIKKDGVVHKYGYPIGYATRDIEEGEWVHTHNVKSALTESVSYEYHPERAPAVHPLVSRELTFNGYKRNDGGVGIRNYVYIIPTVFCVNGPIEKLAAMAEKEMPASANFDGFIPYTHECGCAETGLNLSYTRSILAGMSKNPNAAGVLFVGLGCEINDLASFKPSLGDFDPTRVKFIAYQDVEDEFEESLKLAAGTARPRADLSKGNGSDIQTDHRQQLRGIGRFFRSDRESAGGGDYRHPHRPGRDIGDDGSAGDVRRRADSHGSGGR